MCNSPFVGQTTMRRSTHGHAHIPVLKETVVNQLVTNTSGTYVDCTVGSGGHAEAILEGLGNSGRVIGLDVDAEAVEGVRKRLTNFGDRVHIAKADFAALRETLKSMGMSETDGVLFDLGLSSMQLDSSPRGFSYRIDGPLDMRMDVSSPKTARDVVNWYTRNELTRIFRDYGEEKHAARISRAVIKGREGQPIESTSQLAAIIRSVISPRNPQKTLSRVFQAIRIEVNDELRKLKMGLRAAIELVRPQGRIVVISYQSLEDRIIKSVFAQKSKGCLCPPNLPLCACGQTKELQLVTRRALRPSEREMEKNPRARSARLRVAEKV